MAIDLKPIEQQVIVITGASSGIGLATALAAAKRGACVVLGARSKDVLDRGNQRAFVVAQHGLELGGSHGTGRGLNFAIAALEAGADKNKTRIHGCRPDRQTNRRAGMNADTGYSGLRTKRCLPAEFHRRLPTTAT